MKTKKRTKKRAYKLVKMYDCQGVWTTPGMPENVLEAYFAVKRYSLDGIGNDSYVDWVVGDFAYGWSKATTTEDKQHHKNILIVDEWLLAHGAKPHEEVIIKHWW